MKKFFVVIIAAMALLAIVVVLIPKHAVSDRAEADYIGVAQAQSAALTTNANETIAREAFLKSIGLTGPQVAFAQTDSCYIDHNDGGWIVQNYNQKCYVQSVVGYRSSETAAEIYQRLQTVSVNDPWSLGFSTCEPLEEQWGMVSTVSVTGGGATDYSQTPCVSPEPNEAAPEVVAYAVADTHTQVLQKSGDAWNGTSGTTIWLTHTNDYWNEDLGCAGGGHLFCEQPRAEPIMAQKRN